MNDAISHCHGLHKAAISQWGQIISPEAFSSSAKFVFVKHLSSSHIITKQTNISEMSSENACKHKNAQPKKNSTHCIRAKVAECPKIWRSEQ